MGTAVTVTTIQPASAPDCHGIIIIIFLVAVVSQSSAAVEKGIMDLRGLGAVNLQESKVHKCERERERESKRERKRERYSDIYFLKFI